MSDPATINPRIIEALYSEALVLSDEVRNAFTLSGRLERTGLDEDLARIALSSEGLRTTSRMMHAIAWLLNHRAYFMGEISALQLHNHGRLAMDRTRSEPDQLALLDPAIARLIETTRHFYERLLRLDHAWRMSRDANSSAVRRLHERIEQRLAG
jgi:regulator of CtrA degradation